MAKGKKSHKILAVCLAVVIVAAGAVVFRAYRHRQTYTTVKAGKGDITTYFSFSGSIDAKSRQTVYADQLMQIQKIDVSEGQTVAKNDVLLETTAGEKIKAPIDGQIASINVEQDQQASPGAKLLQIADYSVMQLKVQVDEYDLSAVTQGKAAAVTVHALGRDLQGTVDSVSQEGTYSNGVTYFDATISLPSDSALRAGMSAEAKVVSQTAKAAVTLPVADLRFNTDNTPYVLVPDAKKRGATRKVPVTVGITDGTTAEIKSGLSAGDEVIVPAAKTDTSSGFFSQRRSMQNSGSGVSTAGTVSGGTVSQ